MKNFERLRKALEVAAGAATGEVQAQHEEIAIRVDLSRLTAAQATALDELGFEQTEEDWYGPDWYVSGFA